MSDAALELGEWFDTFWMDENAWVYLPVKFSNIPEPKNWKKFMFRWPRRREEVIEHVLLHSAQGHDTYFAPSLFKVANPKKEDVLGTWFLWVDSDGNALSIDELAALGIPEPSITIQSSLPGHEHSYWALNDFLTDAALIEERNRALAYTMKADTSGWDADQVLRPPHTTNQKRSLPVLVKSWER